MTNAANSPSADRTGRVLGFIAYAIAVAFIGLWSVLSISRLTDFIEAQDATGSLLMAIGVVAGPILFWSFIGIGIGMSVLGWIAGLASTGILVSLTYAYLIDASDSRGFADWVVLTMIVCCNVAAFCVMPYALVCGAVRRR
ncbi:hypothetical protein [Streptomyces sp. NPDC056337]|uniref:hypothetical protein n=1 Tax=Streptomyces sp. NPDC056337 TaxID=3345787 RepID=UPI0035E1248D